MSAIETRNSLETESGFDLKRGLLGPNLRLRNQLTPQQEKEFFNNPPILLATYYPHSSLGPQGIFAVGEIYTDCYQAFGLERLQEINQLGEINFLVEEWPIYFPPQYIAGRIERLTGGSRWLHTLTTGVVTELILRNNRFPEETIKIGITAALLHDAAITPFSDLVSGMNPQVFDEAQNLPLYLEGIKGGRKEAFERKHSPDYQKILEAVGGQGTLGTILKIADRLAYLAHDSSPLVSLLKDKRRISLKRGENPLEELVDIFEENPCLFDIFKEVKFDPEREYSYFEDSHNLDLILRIKALMETYVYRNPRRLGFQAVVRRETKDLMRRGRITIDDFLRMTDLDFATEISPHLPPNSSVTCERIKFVKGPNMETVSQELAGVIEENPGDYSIVWLEEVTGFDTLTNWLVRDKDGEIKPFFEACPKKTEELETLVRQTRGIVVYFLKGDGSQSTDGISG